MDSDPHPNPYQDVSSWWSIFFSGGYSWRWFERPHLYFRPLIEYVPPATHHDDGSRFTVVDGLGREKPYDKPLECLIDPFSGRIQKLYVQAPASICRLPTAGNPNGTWKRTPVRNVTPIALRIANLPFRFVPAQRRYDRSLFTVEDWLIVIAMWIPAVVAFFLSVSLPLYAEHQWFHEYC